MKYIEYGVFDGVAYITLNRPEKSNALCYDLVSELRVAFKGAEADPNVKVIVLKARGEEKGVTAIQNNSLTPEGGGAVNTHSVVSDDEDVCVQGYIQLKRFVCDHDDGHPTPYNNPAAPHLPLTH